MKIQKGKQKKKPASKKPAGRKKQKKEESAVIFDSNVGNTDSLFVAAPEATAVFENLFNTVLICLVIVGLLAGSYVCAAAIKPAIDAIGQISGAIQKGVAGLADNIISAVFGKAAPALDNFSAKLSFELYKFNFTMGKKATASLSSIREAFLKR